MSVFDRLDRMTSRRADAVFSIRFECHPSKATLNGRPRPDPEREIWIAKGVLDENPIDTPVEIGKRDRVGNDLRTLVNGNSLELSVDKVRYPQAVTAKQGDRIRLDDMRKLEISSVRSDGQSRIVFSLIELK